MFIVNEIYYRAFAIMLSPYTATCYTFPEGSKKEDSPTSFWPTPPATTRGTSEPL